MPFHDGGGAGGAMDRLLIVAGLFALCCAGCGGPCGTFAGDLEFRSQSDADGNTCYERITKDLQVNANEGLTRFSLPHLVAVDGSLRIEYSYDLRGSISGRWSTSGGT
jgi:hypothetical protein